jgi:RNA polymerase sigma-70 factor (sigma-E family)
VTDRADAGVAALYRDDAHALLMLLWARTGDRAVAEDLVQEAFVRVHRAWHRIDDRDRAPAYLRSVALNLLRSRWRHERVVARHPDLLVERAAPSAELEAMVDEDRIVLAAALARLPARQRECLVLRYVEGTPEVATASMLGISVNSVKTHVRRGLAALRPELVACGLADDGVAPGVCSRS